MEFGILSLLPPVLSIVLAIITKQVIISLFVGVWVGAAMLNDFNPFLGLVSTFGDYIIPQIGDPWNASVLCLTTLCGAFSALLERGGGAFAFAQSLEGKISTRKQGQLVTWLGSFCIFFSDSTNPVLVGPIFRPVTDRLLVSREKLSYIVDSTTAAMPVLLPFTAWGAYIISIISKEYEALGYAGNPLLDFVAGVPYQYYSIGCLLMVAVIAVSGLDFGPMKRAEERALREGKVQSDMAKPLRKEIPLEVPEDSTPSVYSMLVPLIVLLASVFGMFLWTGGYPEKSFFTALGNASSMTSLVVSFFLAAATAMIFTIKSRVLTLQKAIETFFMGCSQMFDALLILVFAWGIGSVCKGVGTSTYLVAATQDMLTPTSMYVILFIASCFTAFATGTSWGVFAIFLPISIALAQAVGTPMAPAIGVVLSGGIFGDHCSPVSDTTVLSSMGSSADHIDHVTTQIPYAITVAFSAAVGYVAAGHSNTAWIGLAVTIVTMCAVLFTIGKLQSHGVFTSESNGK